MITAWTMLTVDGNLYLTPPGRALTLALATYLPVNMVSLIPRRNHKDPLS
jgi:hypothetical protein